MFKKKEKNLKIKVVSVSTLKEAISVLENYKNNRRK